MLHILDIAGVGQNLEGAENVRAATDAKGLDGLGRLGVHNGHVLRRYEGLARVLPVIDLLEAVRLLDLLRRLGRAGGRDEAARADVLHHAQQGRDGGLVVVGAERAGRDALVDAARGEKDAGKGGDDADDPQRQARGRGNEAHDLHEGADGNDVAAQRRRLHDEGEVRREGGRVEEVLPRGVVVGNHDDGTVALRDERPARPVDCHDVLAARGRPEGEGRCTAEQAQDGEKRRDQREHEANDREHDDPEPGDEDSQEHEHRENRRNEAGERRGVKLLDARLHVMVAHQTRDGLGGLQLLLAVGGSDSDPLVEIVEIVMCHGHTGNPFAESLETNPSTCIQFKEYTSYPWCSLKKMQTYRASTQAGRFLRVRARSEGWWLAA